MRQGPAQKFFHRFIFTLARPASRVRSTRRGVLAGQYTASLQGHKWSIGDLPSCARIAAQALWIVVILPGAPTRPRFHPARPLRATKNESDRSARVNRRWLGTERG